LKDEANRVALKLDETRQLMICAGGIDLFNENILKHVISNSHYKDGWSGIKY
jgi:hypothetical protein